MVDPVDPRDAILDERTREYRERTCLAKQPAPGVHICGEAKGHDGAHVCVSYGCVDAPDREWQGE